MTSGWTNDGAVNEQINSAIEDAVAHTRGKLPMGKSLYEYEECGNPIPRARREAVLEVCLCTTCQQDRGSHGASPPGYNRGDSENSQPHRLILTKSFSAYDFLYEHASSHPVQ